MTSKEFLNQIRSAPWSTDEEVDAAAADVADLQTADVPRLLDAVTARIAPDAQARRLQCLAFARAVERVPDKTLFPVLVRALKGADPQLRGALVQLIPRVNSVPHHAELTALLRSADQPLRGAAAKALAEIGGRTAFQLLSEMVKEPTFPGRMEAMEVMVALAGHNAIPALQSILSVGSNPEKLRAISHLMGPRCGGKDPRDASRAIAEAFTDTSEAVVLHALSAFSALASEDDATRHLGRFLDDQNLNLARAAIEGLKRFESSRVVALLHRKLRSGPNVLRLAAVAALEAIGNDAVLTPLVDALGHKHVAVRVRAAEALSHLGAEGRLDLVRTIIWLLRSRDVNVRRMAGEVAQSVRDPDGELWPKLLDSLRDEDWWVRERVTDALVEMAGKDLLRHVAAFLNDPSDLVRRFAVDTLLRLRAPESLGALVRTAAGDTDWLVRERAIEAVAALHDPRAAAHLVDIMLRNLDLQVACLHALAEIPALDAAPHVIPLLESPETDVAVAALRYLKAMDDRGHSTVVQAVAADPRPEVRSLARELLTRWDLAPEHIPTPSGSVSHLDQLLMTLANAQGDDLILKAGHRPMAKRFGKTEPLGGEVLSAEEVRTLLLPHLSGHQLEELKRLRDVDFSYQVKSERLRFRANVFHEFGGLSAVFRIVRGTLLELEGLGLPPMVATLTGLKDGLVLVGGPTGSGKSTTLAAIIDSINRTSARHIISLEDPIEVVHERRTSLVNQREIGTHARSFSDALRYTLRQDPDVIVIGEMRDFATISFAVSAAETGHLVFGSIHTASAATTIDRLVNACPAGQQDYVRSMLAGSLRAVICQYLIPRTDGPGRVLAVEVMLNNEAVANLVRKGKTFQLPSVIATSREAGMQLMDGELMRLFRDGKISGEEAYMKAVSKKDFETLVAVPPAGPEEGRPHLSAAGVPAKG